MGRLDPNELEAFEAAFQRQMARSYSWDLWGAAWLIHDGGESDDGFEYFRRWLISKGRRVFEHVTADPDSLGDILATNSRDALEFEAFAYVAGDVWSEKTGRDAGEMPRPSVAALPAEPSGVPFEEDRNKLAGRYPRIWRLFGTQPLG